MFKPQNNILLLVAVLFCITSYAQRPKIGLTLSGGGAKGLAHVGVLQALDSAGLKIDYITGTSMGSIVGAMYATGYSGNQIDSIAKRLDWIELMSGKPKYTDVSIEEKDEFDKYTFEIPMEGLQAKMGPGLIESEEVWLQFAEIFFHAYDEKDFSKFDIPFKCIATDLNNGQAVVLDSGELVKALRSSMALPSIFAAVEYNDTYLVDGGIVRNFPVSDAIEMGADYVIGVNLFSGLTDAKELNSAIDVMYQITNYRDADDLVKQKKLCDVLIEPPLEGYSAGSFTSSSEILDIGYEMREKYYPIFKRIADSLNSIEKVAYDPYDRYNPNESVIIDNFEVVGLVSMEDKDFLDKNELETGVSYTVGDLNTAFRNQYSTLAYQYIYYELIPSGPGHATMRIILKEQYPDMFKVAFSYHSFTTPAIYLNYTMRNLFLKKSRTYAKIALSEDMKAKIEHRQFMGPHLTQAVSLSMGYVQQRIPIYEEDVKKYQYKTANTAIDLSYSKYLGQNSLASLSLLARNTQFSPDIASAFRFDGSNKDLYTKVEIAHNSTNSAFLPTDGLEASASFGMEFYRRFNSQYSDNDSIVDTTFAITPKDPLLRFDFRLSSFKPFNPRLTMLTNIQGGLLFDDKNFYLDNFLIGGNQQLYDRQYTFVGYTDGQIAATSFISGLIGVQYKLIADLYVIGKANVGLYNFVSPTDFTMDVDNKLISGFSAVIAYNFSMLPFEMSLNYSPELNTLHSHIRIGFIF